jgi:hypothetical protein
VADKYVLVAILNENNSSLFSILKAFPSRKVHLLVTEERKPLVERAKQELLAKGISAQTWYIHELWENTLSSLAEIVDEESNVLVYAASDGELQAALVSATFVLGVPAVHNEKQLVPTIPVSYYALLGDKKMRILKTLMDKPHSLDMLSRKMKVSSPLLIYHLQKNGLIAMDLVEKRGSLLSLTKKGNLLMKGFIEKKP